MSKLRVAIDFRIDDPRQGVGTAVLALAHGLSRINGDQEYVFIVPEHVVDWLKPHVSGPCSIFGVPAAPPSRIRRLKNSLAKVPLLRALWFTARRGNLLLPVSDGIVERLGFDVVHFPSQIAYATAIPSVYQPWDLQHRHLPEFFTKEELRLREVRYPAFCRQAKFVCIQTEWGKQDLIRQFGIAPDKIRVIRWGSAFEAYEPVSKAEAEKVRQELSLPEEFFVYPAVTWPHKNHAVILKALALLHQAQGRAVTVIFTGATTPLQKDLEKLAESLQIKDHVRFLGFVSTKQIQAIFQLASGLLFPSKFEGLGLPVLEAFRVGLPVICASATVLPEVSESAALLFDPDSPKELMDAIERLRNTPGLRAELVEQGFRTLGRYTADAAAREFVALYKAAAATSNKESA